jgi:hypothetical protein
MTGAKADDVKTLLPEVSVELSGDRRVLIGPVPFGKTPLFTGAISSLVQKVAGAGVNLKDLENWEPLLKVAFEETVKVIGLVIDKPRPWFDTISLSDGLEIIDVIVSQNFDERAKKKITKYRPRVESLLSTLSKTSLPADTRLKK